MDKLKILLKKEETQSLKKSFNASEVISSLGEKSVNKIKSGIELLKNEVSNIPNRFNKSLPPSIKDKGQLVESFNIRKWSNENVSRYLIKGLEKASIHRKNYRKVMERLEKAKKEPIWW